VQTARKDTPLTASRNLSVPERTNLKQERSVQTRAQILNAAADAFAARGFPSVTIQDVAQLTGMTKGAVYFHYANKESLAVAVTKSFYRKMHGIADGIADEGRSSLDALVEFLLRISIAFRDDTLIQAGARLQIERALITTPLPTPYQDVTELIIGWLEQARESGELGAEVAIDEVVQVLVSAVFGAQHISWVLSERADLVDRVHGIIRVVLPVAAAEADRRFPSA
jgi:AcrR family transcriptional regulator